MTGRRFLLLLLLVAATRLPFIGFGYGSDADAWRVAATAYRLAESGAYRVSRFPGFPLYELLVTPFVAAGGSLLANATSIAAMILLLLVWRRIVRNASHPGLLMLCLAFTPILWKNSATTMDYLWSLLFLLLSFERLGSTERLSLSSVAAAGALLGIAAGFRPTNAVMAVPLLLMLRGTGTSPRSVTVFLGAAVLTAVLAFLPPLVTYGPSAWYELTRRATADIAFGTTERLLLFSYRSTYLLGPPAVLAAGVVFWRARPRVAHDLHAGDPVVVARWTGVLAPLILYFVFPLEREYLIPLVPFLLLLIDRYAGRTAMAVVLAAVVSMAFVTPDVIRHQGLRGVPGFNVHAGVLADAVVRSKQILKRRTILGHLSAPSPALVMTGSGPEAWVENPLLQPDTAAFWRSFDEVVVRRRDDPGVHLIDALPPIDVARVRAAGYRVYCFGPAQEYLEKVLRYRMDSLAIPVLPSGTAP